MQPISSPAGRKKRGWTTEFPWLPRCPCSRQGRTGFRFLKAETGTALYLNFEANQLLVGEDARTVFGDSDGVFGMRGAGTGRTLECPTVGVSF